MSRPNRIFLPAELLCPPPGNPPAPVPEIPTGNPPPSPLFKRRGRFTLERNQGQIKIHKNNLHLMNRGAGKRWLIFEQRGCVKRFLGGSNDQRTVLALFDYFVSEA